MKHVTTSHLESMPKVNMNTETYNVYLVFQLPSVAEIADANGRLMISPQEFLERCINNAKERNSYNLREGHPHSQDYFTSLNHAERYRIPTTLTRLNAETEIERFGILSFWVNKDEQVKNKVYNQRTSSINPLLIDLDRAVALYYPDNYKIEKTVDLYKLGKLEHIEQEKFHVVFIDKELLQSV